MQFEELHQKQSQWTVPDTELGESLRLAVAEVLLPAYRAFIKRFGYVYSSFIFATQIYILLKILVAFEERSSYLQNEARMFMGNPDKRL